MIEQMFIQILNMSLTGSIVILAVLLIRFLLKKAPKIFSYCLWAAVLFRLLCPVSFTAAFSLFSMLQAPSSVPGKLEYIPQDLILHTQTDTLPSAADYSTHTHHVLTGAAAPEDFKPSYTEWIPHTAAVLWLLGIAALMFYNLWNLYKLKQSLKTAVWEKENIYLSQQAATPFVMGIFRPRIYLPSHLGTDEKAYVLLHEQIHLKRKDHIIKLISYLALCLHWFNPLVWAAFFLSGKDMEMSCDEAVIRKTGSSIKKEYSCSLLSIAAGKTIPGGIPLAFGEGDTGSRINNILHYKKPAAIVVKGAALLCGTAVIVLLANPDINAETEKASAVSANEITDTDTNTQLFDQTADTDADRTLYEVTVRSIAKETRAIDAYIPHSDDPLFADGKPLPFADNCRFLVNYSMNSLDYKEVSYNLFTALIQAGGTYLNKPCLLGFEDGRIVHAALQSAWDHYGITPSAYIDPGYFYDTILESEGENAFYKNYTLISSETMDIADCEGKERIEVYTDSRNNSENSVVLFKNKDGQVLFTQDANLSRAGWNNIYLGSINGTPFILTVQIEDRWDTGEFRYQAFRLTSEGTPSFLSCSNFDFGLTEGSNIVYNDTLFQKWITPLEDYLKNSHLILSSQDGELRTEKIPEADKYNYDTLSLKDRAPEISANYNDCLIRFHDSWYSRRSLKEETVEWLLWYNSLSEREQLSVNSITPELIDAEYLIYSDTQDAQKD